MITLIIVPMTVGVVDMIRMSLIIRKAIAMAVQSHLDTLSMVTITDFTEISGAVDPVTVRTTRDLCLNGPLNQGPTIIMIREGSTGLMWASTND